MYYPDKGVKPKRSYNTFLISTGVVVLYTSVFKKLTQLFNHVYDSNAANDIPYLHNFTVFFCYDKINDTMVSR